MKKIIPLLVLFLSAAVFSASAQETKTKPITTPTDKVHNVIHPHHKIAHGTKHKHESVTHHYRRAAMHPLGQAGARLAAKPHSGVESRVSFGGFPS